MSAQVTHAEILYGLKKDHVRNVQGSSVAVSLEHVVKTLLQSIITRTFAIMLQTDLSGNQSLQFSFSSVFALHDTAYIL